MPIHQLAQSVLQSRQHADLESVVVTGQINLNKKHDLMLYRQDVRRMVDWLPRKPCYRYFQKMASLQVDVLQSGFDLVIFQNLPQ